MATTPPVTPPITSSVVKIAPSLAWSDNPVTQALSLKQRRSIIRSAVGRAVKAGQAEAVVAVNEQYSIARRYLVGPRTGSILTGTESSGLAATLRIHRKALPLNKDAGFTVRELKPKRRMSKAKAARNIRRAANYKPSLLDRTKVKTPQKSSNLGGVIATQGPGNQTYFRNAFVTRVRSAAQKSQGIAGHVGVFSRAKHGGGFARRLPIRERYGPSALDVVNTETVIDRVSRRMLETLETRLMAGLTRFAAPTEPTP